MVKRFEDLIAWQKGQDLCVEVYNNFRNSKDYSFRDQICRASVSICNNIAEGFDRSSNADFVRFLYMATGSTSEVRSMLYLAKRLDYINPDKAQTMIDGTNEVSKIIYGLIKSLTNN